MDSEIRNVIKHLEETLDADISIHRNGDEWEVRYSDDDLIDEEFCGSDLMAVLHSIAPWVIQWRRDFLDGE